MADVRGHITRLLLVGLTACRPSETPSAPTRPAPSAPETTSDTWITALTPADGMEYDGRAMLMQDGQYLQWQERVRLAYTNGSSKVADSFPATPFIDSAEDDEREGAWWFGTLDGQIYWAREWTGKLTRVEGVERCWWLSADGGSLYCGDTTGRVWGSASDNPLRLEHRLDDVSSFVAHDGRLLVVRFDGTLESVRDGKCEKVDTGLACVEYVSAWGSRVSVAASGQTRILQPDGSWEEDESRGPSLPTDFGPNTRAGIDAAVSGTEAFFARFPGASYPASVERARLNDTEDDGPPGRCTSESGDVGAISLCWPERSDGVPPTRLTVQVRSAKGWSAQDPPALLVSWRGDATRTSGPDVVIVGYCEEPADEPYSEGDSVPLCWFSGGERKQLELHIRDAISEGDEREARPVASPDGDDEAYRDPRSVVGVESLSGSWLLLTIDGALRLFDLRQGMTQQPPWSKVPKGRRSEGPALADGEVWAVYEHDGRRTLVHGPPTAAPRMHPLPDGAKRVARATSDRWMATGDTLGQAWSTTDGGASWTRLLVEVDGDPNAFPIRRPQCDEHHCLALPLLWVHPDHAPEYKPPTYIGPTKKLPEPPDSRDVQCDSGGG